MVLLLGLLLSAASAHAAPSPKDRAEAKTSWTKGKRLLGQRKFDDAAAAFRLANELDPKVQYQLDLARALVDAKAFVEARELCDQIASSKEANTQRAKQAAAQLKKSLEPRIPTLKVEVGGADAAQATVTINGETVRSGSELPYDPGSYTVKAKVGAGPETVEQVELAEGQHRAIRLELGKAQAIKSPSEENDSGGGGNMAPAAVSYAVGGALLAAGGVLGGLAFDQTSKTEEACGGTTCPPELADEVALAQDYGTASTVLFAVGGLGVAAGIILTFTVGMDGGDAQPEKAGVSPFLGLGQAGVRGRF